MKSANKLQWIKFPANYITNRIVTREYALDLIDKGRTYPYLGEVKKELMNHYSEDKGGIDLSFSEARIVYSIAYRFTVNDYQGYVEFRKNQFFDALGYNKSPCGWEKTNLIERLERLSEKKFPFVFKNNEGIRFISFGSLYSLDKAIEQKNKAISYKIKLNSGLWRYHRNDFRLADPQIGMKIRLYRDRNNKRPSKYDIRFYDLLLNENKEAIEWNYLKIAKGPMLMENLIKNRKYKQIRKRLISIYEMYRQLGYLSSYKADQKGTKFTKDVFHLNPDKFYKLRESNNNEK